MNERADIRFIKANGAIYLRLEDVALFIVNLGSCEETDVRNRLNEAAANLIKKNGNS